jgi:DNA uptake protein ComE-like DNA-binding protein
MPAININTASQEELKTLGDKLGIADLPSKIEEKRPYNDINELVSKEVISPQQLDYIQNDILVKDVSETTE